MYLPGFPVCEEKGNRSSKGNAYFFSKGYLKYVQMWRLANTQGEKNGLAAKLLRRTRETSMEW